MTQNSSMVELAVANLLGIFNERDRSKRFKALEDAYEPSVVLFDPNDIKTGYEAITAFVSQLLNGNSSWTFRHPGKAWINHDLVTME